MGHSRSPAISRQREKSGGPNTLGRKFKIGKDKDKSDKQDSKLGRKLTSDKLDSKGKSRSVSSFALGKKGQSTSELKVSDHYQFRIGELVIIQDSEGLVRVLERDKDRRKGKEGAKKEEEFKNQDDSKNGEEARNEEEGASVSTPSSPSSTNDPSPLLSSGTDGNISNNDGGDGDDTTTNPSDLATSSESISTRSMSLAEPSDTVVPVRRSVRECCIYGRVTAVGQEILKVVSSLFVMQMRKTNLNASAWSRRFGRKENLLLSLCFPFKKKRSACWVKRPAVIFVRNAC